MRVQDDEQLVGYTVIDADGRRIGIIRRVLCPSVDPYRAEWAIVSLSRWRRRAHLIPLTGASHHDRSIQVPHLRAAVATSPHIPRRSDDSDVRQAHAHYSNEQR